MAEQYPPAVPYQSGMLDAGDQNRYRAASNRRRCPAVQPEPRPAMHHPGRPPGLPHISQYTSGLCCSISGCAAAAGRLPLIPRRTWGATPPASGWRSWNGCAATWGSSAGFCAPVRGVYDAARLRRVPSAAGVADRDQRRDNHPAVGDRLAAPVPCAAAAADQSFGRRIEVVFGLTGERRRSRRGS